MAYNNGREDRKWRIWKEAEEKILREHGVDEDTIRQIRIDDRADFNSNRRFYHWTSDYGEYLEAMADKEQSDEVKTIEDLLDEIGTIIIKDHSRLGRNRLVVGQLLEEDFERLNVRYIVIMDNIDTAKGISDLVPMQDSFNEWHAKNTSQKVKNVFRNKGMSGIPLTNNLPYGYKKNPENHNKGF